MVQKSQGQPPGISLKTLVYNGRSYQPQLVQDFWTINSIWKGEWRAVDFFVSKGILGTDLFGGYDFMRYKKTQEFLFF